MTIDVLAAVDSELSTLNGLLKRKELQAVIEKYPIRETPALGEISKQLGFQGPQQYEAAVRKLLMDNADALAFVRSMFGHLSDELMK